MPDRWLYTRSRSQVKLFHIYVLQASPAGFNIEHFKRDLINAGTPDNNQQE
jgi:hypothetical protein